MILRFYRSSLGTAVLFSLMCQAPVANKLTSFEHVWTLGKILPKMEASALPVEGFFPEELLAISAKSLNQIQPLADQQPLVDCRNAAIQAAEKTHLEVVSIPDHSRRTTPGNLASRQHSCLTEAGQTFWGVRVRHHGSRTHSALVFQRWKIHENPFNSHN
eukprot:s2239_g10.t1